MLPLTLALLVWVSPLEQTYGPYVGPYSDPHAIAVSRDAMLLAWSEVDPTTSKARIHFGLLDFGARLISPIVVVPLTRAGVDALRPEVTSDGAAFRITYMEGGQLYAIDVDAAGEAATPPQPVAGRGNEEPPGTAIWRRTPIYSGCFLFHCRLIGWKNELVWSGAGVNGVFDAGDGFVGPVAITAARDRVSFAWASGGAIHWLFTSGESASIPASATVTTAPAFACGAQECVVAYGTTSGDVHAVSFEIDQPFNAMPVVVNASERWEHAPQVHALPGNMFLVSYASDATYDTTNHRIAGRVLSNGPVKRRAVE